ncbi:MAG: hypothetical protein HFI82_10675 [Eubacterium sp.]|jgi:hypothetical protein|nr:hypothetical protein [Eubacterium sp.]
MGKEHMNLATEILNDMKRPLSRCRAALIISLAGNIIQAAVLIFRKMEKVSWLRLLDCEKFDRRRDAGNALK